MAEEYRGDCEHGPPPPRRLSYSRRPQTSRPNLAAVTAVMLRWTMMDPQWGQAATERSSTP